jgi:hypothetical protein
MDELSMARFELTSDYDGHVERGLKCLKADGFEIVYVDISYAVRKKYFRKIDQLPCCCLC